MAYFGLCAVSTLIWPWGKEGVRWFYFPLYNFCPKLQLSVTGGDIKAGHTFIPLVNSFVDEDLEHLLAEVVGPD